MSALRRHVEDYLALRRGLGFKLGRTGQHLESFAGYLEQAGAVTVTIEQSLSNFLCELRQLLSFCYITVDIFCPGQTGTRSGNATANEFMAAFQPRVPVPRCPLARTSPSPSIWRPVTFLIPR
jgi:hypothetical protein